ncbi:hypothetical protein KZZ52_10970 [Dactylosporangium sp. AC04546]|uniref:hypothetical protein n=1 Tax=Dactylosporangium sp. AC04546 TaxID=2862460 RepID=UPI001EE01D8C|nr:hypothetical protein [Dactylosporangium sp. AC04546]WVK85872.1 hypothetical protein KZZ52_10970 [Dactylosporangium sp. AC04546]
MKPRLAAAAVLLALALTGCADDPGTTAGEASTAPSATTAPSESPTAGEAPSPTASAATLVAFTRTGGIAGVNDRLTVAQDGSYTIQTRSGTKTGKLAPQELAALKQALGSVDFTKIPNVNANNGTVADGFTYSVIYNGREIVAEDGAIPPALQPILGTLSAVLSK